MNPYHTVPPHMSQNNQNFNNPQIPQFNKTSNFNNAPNYDTGPNFGNAPNFNNPLVHNRIPQTPSIQNTVQLNNNDQSRFGIQSNVNGNTGGFPQRQPVRFPPPNIPSNQNLTSANQNLISPNQPHANKNRNYNQPANVLDGNYQMHGFHQNLPNNQVPFNQMLRPPNINQRPPPGFPINDLLPMGFPKRPPPGFPTNDLSPMGFSNRPPPGFSNDIERPPLNQNIPPSKLFSNQISNQASYNVNNVNTHMSRFPINNIQSYRPTNQPRFNNMSPNNYRAPSMAQRFAPGNFPLSQSVNMGMQMQNHNIGIRMQNTDHSMGMRMQNTDSSMGMQMQNTDHSMGMQMQNTDRNIDVDLKQQHIDSMKGVVDDWLRVKQLGKLSKILLQSDSLLKLHEYKLAVESHLKDIEELRLLNDDLAENMESGTEVWKLLLEKVEQLKIKIQRNEEVLFNNKQMNFINTQIRKRKKKRDLIKRNKLKRNNNYVDTLAKRIKLNEQIDEWQQKEQRKIIEKKMIDNLKNEAGESLQEVKRKSSEATELVQVLTLLKELRDRRKDTAIYKGVLVTPKDNEKFDGEILKVTTLLTNQKQIYNNEERALKCLREEETEEINRKQSEERKKRNKNRRSALDKVDPLFTYRFYWLQGEDSVHGLIHVRNLWDMYLCRPGGSRIPKGWIEPSIPSNNEWKKFIKIINRRKSDVKKAIE